MKRVFVIATLLASLPAFSAQQESETPLKPGVPTPSHSSAHTSRAFEKAFDRFINTFIGTLLPAHQSAIEELRENLKKEPWTTPLHEEMLVLIEDLYSILSPYPFTSQSSDHKILGLVEALKIWASLGGPTSSASQKLLTFCREMYASLNLQPEVPFLTRFKVLGQVVQIGEMLKEKEEEVRNFIAFAIVDTFHRSRQKEKTGGKEDTRLSICLEVVKTNVRETIKKDLQIATDCDSLNQHLRGKTTPRAREFHQPSPTALPATPATR